MKYRAPFALILGLAFLSACSAGSMSTQGLVPQGSLSHDRSGMSVAPPPAPSPGPLTVLAGVDLDQSGLLPVFKLTSTTACFGGTPAVGGGGDEDSDGHGDRDGHHQDRDSHDGGGEHHSHHGHGHDGGDGGASGVGVAPAYGTAFTPATNLMVYIGTFTLTDPCGAPAPIGGGLGLNAAVRTPMTTVPGPTGSAFIVYLDSTDATHTPQILVGPAAVTGSTYTFTSLRVSHTFRVGHTYTFALAGPAPSPAPSPTPTPHEHGDD